VTDPDETTPMKYLQIRDQLLDQLESMAPGEPLPPERVLAERFGVSRMTLRRALGELVTAGRAVRRQGAGVFATGPKVAQSLAATSFSEEMRRRGLEPGARTLESQTVAAGARIGRRLEVSPGDDVLRVERLRLADGSPMAIEILHVPMAVVPGLSGPHLVDRSFYEVLGREYGVRIAGGVQTIEPTVTDPAESEVLEVPLHSPALLFERVSRDQDGRVVEFVRSVYRGDRYRIETAIVPDQVTA
jgi:GntR family transcriptional regulator